MADRTWTGAGLVLAGALMFAASWQRWAGVCADQSSPACVRRQDHLYDFAPALAPWEQVGHAAELGGLSLLVFALILPLLPFALTGREPGRYAAVALAASVLATGAVGVTSLWSGLSGELVAVPLGSWTVSVWWLLPTILVARWAVGAPGWVLAAALALIVALPVVAVFYSIGDYDSRPWQEAYSGVFMALAGLCLIVAAGATALSRARADGRQPPGASRPDPGSGSTPAAH